MKLSIFTTATNPIERGDTYEEALASYNDLADEVVETGHDWPYEFNWPHIGQTFHEGYELATGDWVIHADLDFIFHEKHMGEIRKVLERSNNEIALSFWKYQFVLPDRYNIKSRLVIAVNKGKYGKHIAFNGGGDLCQPTFDGKDIKPGNIPEARIPFYNYEKIKKTKQQVKEDVARMDRAWHRYHNQFLYSEDGSDESALEGWLDMMVGRHEKPQEAIALTDHPKYMIDTIKNLKPEHFGYSMWGRVEKARYYA